eukprot:gene9275-19253_t
MIVGNTDRSVENHGSIIYCRCQHGPPMPARLQPYISEPTFFQLRGECIRARNKRELDEIISSYNRAFNLRGGLVIYAEEDRVKNFFEKAITAMGMGPERVLGFDMSILQNTAAGSLQAVQYMEPENFPVAEATTSSPIVFASAVPITEVESHISSNASSGYHATVTANSYPVRN